MNPPKLFSWSVTTLEEGVPMLGAVGITDDPQRAMARVAEALREAPPSARGVVHRVTRSFARCGYLYECLVASGALDPGSDAIVWEEFAARSWGTREVLPPEIACSMPPEAMVAGLADLEAERDRERQAVKEVPESREP